MKFLFFHQMVALQKLSKSFLFQQKSSFRPRDFQIFLFFLPSFPHFPDSKGQMELEYFMIS